MPKKKPLFNKNVAVFDYKYRHIFIKELCTPDGNRTHIVGTGIRYSIH